ncbi:MAG: copper amine oxidase N-terminal domain-containing protein, partial [Candidatus Eremiobacteraeota bacterium]|nr:copper amine oxidase N-terminal domain-containing protein [Candidatus Eremiobacteraeota bacterium]
MKNINARPWYLALVLSVIALPSAALAPASATAPDFGSPPSGAVPILFNDHHVYSKPDKLKAGRVLAALVKGGTILVPLRSLFEQTGATVTYTAATKTVDVSKPGSDVMVTLGKHTVTLNGEVRPLDVAPEMYKGVLLEPLRVISEGMGAYVQWVPDKRVVIVRYIPIVATPPPTPTPAPTATPA